MTKSLKDRFKGQGITSEFLRNTLLRRAGLAYGDSVQAEDIDFTVEPLGTSFGIDTELYGLDVFRVQEGVRIPLRRFVVKDHVAMSRVRQPYGDGTQTHGRGTKPMRERFGLEASMLKHGAVPLHTYWDDGKKRIIMDRWDGSLDELLTDAYQLFTTEKRVGIEGRIRQRVQGYVAAAISSYVQVFRQLTDIIEELRLTEFPPETKSNAERATKLALQVGTIVERSLRSEGEAAARAGKDKVTSEGLREGSTLRDELVTLGTFLAAGNHVIHHDTRANNFLIRRPPDLMATSSELPDVARLVFAPCDYDVREGPIEQDLAILANDPYVRAFGFNQADRYNFFEHGLQEEWRSRTRGDETLGTQETRTGFIMEETRAGFILGTTVAMIEKSANAIAIEGMDPKAFERYVQGHPLENNQVYIPGNLLCFEEALEGTERFPELREILSKARKKFVGEDDGTLLDSRATV